MQKVISRSIYNLKIDTIYVYDIPFDRSFLQLSNGIRHVMPSTERKLELTVKASMAQPVSQPAVCSNGLRCTERFNEVSVMNLRFQTGPFTRIIFFKDFVTR